MSCQLSISLYGSLVLLQPPSAPSNLSAQYSTTGPKVVVQWDRNSSSEGVTKYAIQRAAGAGEFSTISDNVPDPGSGTTVTYNDQDPPVPTAGYWRYRVMAYNNYGGWGDYCSPVSEDSPPTAPTDLSGEYVPPELGGPEVDLEWNRNPEGQDVDTYWLERAVEDGDFECIDARIADPGSGSIVYYTDDDLPTADYWRYRVRAKNSVAWGEFCAPIEVYATGIEKKDAYVTIQPLPTELTLDQNYPNPFNPTTAVRYGLPKLTRVYLRILNIRGQVVRTLVDDEKPAGWYTVTWDGKNESGQDVASGIYLYLIETDEGKILKKMTLLR